MAEPDSSAPVFTIGYGSRSFAELVALLQEHSIACLVDIRSAPYSRFRPEFSKEALETALKGHGIRYVFLGDALGGRPADPDCSVNGKVDYDRVREKEFYRCGIERVCRAREQGMSLVLMCSEGRPEDCHRSALVGVSLAGLGIPMTHLDEEGLPRSQEEVLNRRNSGQPSLFGDSFLTSRKRYGADK